MVDESLSQVSFTATAVTEDLNLFDDMKKKKVVVNTDNIIKCIISMHSYFFNCT